MISYATYKSDCVAAVAKAYKVQKLNGRDEGRAKHISALVAQSINRHGPNVPKAVVYNEVRNAARRSGAYGNPLLILLMPFIIQFIQSMLPIIMQYIIDLLNNMTKEDKVAQLAMLGANGKTEWSLDV